MAMRAKKPVFLLPMRVWDLSTRLFHWSLPVLLIISYVSVTFADGPNADLLMRIHVIAGEVMLGVLLFRLLWGLFGSETARLFRLVQNPLKAFSHLTHITKREPDTQIGHNAAGGWMVLIMLTVLAVQVGTGLFANDDGNTEGPLMRFVDKPTSDWLSKIHDLNFNVVVGVVVLHLAAIAAYAVLKRHNLVSAMITGKKRLPATSRAPRMGNPWLALATLAVSASVAVAVSQL